VTAWALHCVALRRTSRPRKPASPPQWASRSSQHEVRPALKAGNLATCGGPKSAAGKAKSALNARRHGLNVSIGADRGLAAAAEALAQQIAGASPSAELLTLARTVAAAQVELVRVRQAANDLLDGSAVSRHGPSRGRESERCERLPDLASPQDQGADLLQQIEALGRYERRAMSRRNRAMQDFDCQRIMEALADGAR